MQMVPILKIGQDARTAVVMHHFAFGGLAVFQQSSVFCQGDHPALEEHLAGECFFVMHGLLHFITLFARRCAGFLWLQFYGKMRFVVNKEMINIRGWDDLKCAPRLLCA